MTDDSERINEIFDFHPCDTPRGMTYYKLSELTEHQQNRLNQHKIDIIRNNQIYLQEHPEVKVITSMLLQGVLRARPKYHVHRFMAKYLMESWADIKKEVEKLAAERQRKNTLDYLRGLYESGGFAESEGPDEIDLQKYLKDEGRRDLASTCRSILDEIIATMEVREKHRVHIQVSGSSENSEHIQLQLEADMDMDCD